MPVIERKCRRYIGARTNHVEAAVLLAISRGHDDARAIVAETGLTFGQVQDAIGVLQEQGFAGEITELRAETERLRREVKGT